MKKQVIKSAFKCAQLTPILKTGYGKISEAPVRRVINMARENLKASNKILPQNTNIAHSEGDCLISLRTRTQTEEPIRAEGKEFNANKIRPNPNQVRLQRSKTWSGDQRLLKVDHEIKENIRNDRLEKDRKAKGSVRQSVISLSAKPVNNSEDEARTVNKGQNPKLKQCREKPIPKTIGNSGVDTSQWMDYTITDTKVPPVHRRGKQIPKAIGNSGVDTSQWMDYTITDTKVPPVHHREKQIPKAIGNSGVDTSQWMDYTITDTKVPPVHHIEMRRGLKPSTTYHMEFNKFDVSGNFDHFEHQKAIEMRSYNRNCHLDMYSTSIVGNAAQADSVGNSNRCPISTAHRLFAGDNNNAHQEYVKNGFGFLPESDEVTFRVDKMSGYNNARTSTMKKNISPIYNDLGTKEFELNEPNDDKNVTLPSTEVQCVKKKRAQHVKGTKRHRSKQNRAQHIKGEIGENDCHPEPNRGRFDQKAPMDSQKQEETSRAVHKSTKQKYDRAYEDPVKQAAYEKMLGLVSRVKKSASQQKKEPCDKTTKKGDDDECECSHLLAK